MNKKLIMSVATTALALAAIGGATVAYFSDTETSTKNKFTSGTIDIAVDETNPWDRTEGFLLSDMKPSYKDHIDFVIKNVGTNPANIWKSLTNIETTQGIDSEPECDAEKGVWNDANHSCDRTVQGAEDLHRIDTVIRYSLAVEVYNPNNTLYWNQTLYNDDIMISQLPDEMFLGMLPSGWTMKVYQTYHMDKDTGNWAQGDDMTFDIKLYAEQLKGIVVLEDKVGDPAFDINQASDYKGTLVYDMSHPTFKFTFEGKAPKANTEYVLITYMDPWPGATGTFALGKGMTDSSGNINLEGDVELGMSLDHAKVWLVLESDWDGTKMSGYHQNDFLFETGLIEYRDTDL